MPRPARAEASQRKIGKVSPRTKAVSAQQSPLNQLPHPGSSKPAGITSPRPLPGCRPESEPTRSANAYAGEKGMAIYPYNDHEGGGAFHQVEQMTWLRSLL